MTKRSITKTFDITGATDTHCEECEQIRTPYGYKTICPVFPQKGRLVMDSEDNVFRHPDCIAAEKGNTQDMEMIKCRNSFCSNYRESEQNRCLSFMNIRECAKAKGICSVCFEDCGHDIGYASCNNPIAAEKKRLER